MDVQLSHKMYARSCSSLLAAVCVAYLVVHLTPGADGHGYLAWPESRQLRYGSPGNANGFGGRFWTDACGPQHHTVYGHTTEWPSPTSAWGSDPNIRTKLTAGTTECFKIIITKNHMGFHQFRIVDRSKCKDKNKLTNECVRNHGILLNMDTSVDQQSPYIKEHPYLFTLSEPICDEPEGERIDVPSGLGSAAVVSCVKIPPEAACKECVLHWFWYPCGDCDHKLLCDPAYKSIFDKEATEKLKLCKGKNADFGYGTHCSVSKECRSETDTKDDLQAWGGWSYAEGFKNCADIEVLPSGGGVNPPVVTEPEVTKPVVTEPEVTKPVVTEPEVTKPVVTEPEVTKPVVTEPEVTKPVVTKPSKPGKGCHRRGCAVNELVNARSGTCNKAVVSEVCKETRNGQTWCNWQSNLLSIGCACPSNRYPHKGCSFSDVGDVWGKKCNHPAVLSTCKITIYGETWCPQEGALPSGCACPKASSFVELDDSSEDGAYDEAEEEMAFAEIAASQSNTHNVSISQHSHSSDGASTSGHNRCFTYGKSVNGKALEGVNQFQAYGEEQCWSYCRKYPKCKLFQFKDGMCTLFNEGASLSGESDGNVVSGPPHCPSTCNKWMNHGTDPKLLIRSEKAKRVGDCRHACLAEVQCNWISFDVTTGACSLLYGPSSKPHYSNTSLSAPAKCAPGMQPDCQGATVTTLGQEHGKDNNYCVNVCNCLVGNDTPNDSCYTPPGYDSRAGKCVGGYEGFDKLYTSPFECVVMEGIYPTSKADLKSTKDELTEGFCSVQPQKKGQRLSFVQRSGGKRL